MQSLQNSRFLTFDQEDAHCTRTVFEAKGVIKASLVITALGYFEAFINGNRVTEDKFIPAFSDYEKRDLSHINMPIFDTFSHRIYYVTYDVTALIADGKNVLACHIGAGWYGQHRSRNEGMPKWGDNTLAFCLTLTKADGTVQELLSDGNNTKWKRSFIEKTSLYFGELHNYLAYSPDWMMPGFCDENWQTAGVRTMPEAELCPTDFTPDRETKSIVPTVIYKFGDTKIYDIGAEYSGYAVLKWNDNARPNCIAVTRYADALNEDGSLQFHYVGGPQRMQRDVFICGDDNEAELYPHFTWHAARYIEVCGDADMTRFAVVHTDLKQIAEFSCDNDTLNWFFDAYVRTQLDNVHGCIPSDCPHRERLGYTGDGQLASGAVMSVFDARNMYKKWMRDIRDCQDKVGGHVQHTAPFYGGGGGPGGWGGAACIVPYRYYEFYHDKEALALSYDSMKAYIGYMVRHTEKGIVVSEEKGGWCLGDWCPPHNDVKIPEAFVNTYYLAKCADITAKTAEILGKTEDIATYEGIKEDAERAIITHYYDGKTGSFCVDETGNSVQGADAFALDLGLGGGKTLQNLVNKYSKLLRFDTGIFGTDLLIRTLFQNGYAQLAFRLLTNETEDSFYNMKKGGATTLWENWDGCDSRCHPMFGAVCEYFISYILGVKIQTENGERNITVTPADIPELKYIRGKVSYPEGTVSVEIKRDENGKQLVIVK